MVTQLSIAVANVANLLGLGYSRLEIWQSLDSGDTYQEITSPTAQPAKVTSFAPSTTFQMGGTFLKFIVNGGAEESVTFDPILVDWTAIQVAGAINAVHTGLASVVDNAIVLTAPTTGRLSSIEITYCDAPSLGFSAGVTYGTDARLTLVNGVLIYTYYDVAGTSTARYKWRYSANGLPPVSDYSDYVLGDSVPLVSSNALSVGSAQFIGLDGRPRKTTVVFVMEDNPSAVSGMAITGGLPKMYTSGDDGFLQFTMVRGLKVKAAIEGTYFVREFVVPDAPAFDLLTVMAAVADPFTVQTTPPLLIRRSV